jgi:hypothetical protein
VSRNRREAANNQDQKKQKKKKMNQNEVSMAPAQASSSNYGRINVQSASICFKSLRRVIFEALAHKAKLRRRIHQFQLFFHIEKRANRRNVSSIAFAPLSFFFKNEKKNFKG